MFALIQFIHYLSSNREEQARLLKGVLLRITIERKEKQKGRNDFWAFKMLYRQWLVLFKLLTNLKKDEMDKKQVAFGFSLPSDLIHVYLRTFAGESLVNIVEASVLNNMSKFSYTGMSFKKLLQLISWFFLWQRIWLCSVFSKRKYDTGWTIELFELGLKAILGWKPDRKYYFFMSMSPSSFLLCYYLSSKLNNQCVFISSNSSMFRTMRYSYLPKARLALCSKFQKEEYKFFRAHDWMVFDSMSLWGLEEQLDLKHTENNGFKYDIAIYSSAEWARNDSYWREKDIQKLKNYELIKNKPYRLFYDCAMNSVFKLKEEFGLRVALFPHPYERILFSKHKIAPPYLEDLKRYGIDYIEEGNNSLKHLYHVKIGVASCSTIITDRWHLGLPAYMYSGKDDKAFHADYDHRYLGDYEKFCFEDKDDLYAKLKSELLV